MSVDEFIKNAKKRILKDSEVKEIDIEKEFCAFAKNLGCKALKLVFFRGRGFPDRTVLCPQGRVFFIEFKRKNLPPTKLQTKVRTMLTRLGFLWFVCDEKGEAEAHLTKFLSG